MAGQWYKATWVRVRLRWKEEQLIIGCVVRIQPLVADVSLELPPFSHSCLQISQQGRAIHSGYDLGGKNYQEQSVVRSKSLRSLALGLLFFI